MTEHRSFTDVVETADELTALYRAPSVGAVRKETEVLDEGCRELIALSTLVFVGTSDRHGHLDVSPRGGPAGFVKVLDEKRLAIPDLNGNNRLDSIRNVIEHPHIALLFVVPGLGETLRVNGAACITTAADVLDLFTDDVRRPKTAIGVTIDHGFVHCAKAFRRSGAWEPDTWPPAECRPSIGRILIGHTGLGDESDAAAVDRDLEASYESDLAADRP